MNIDFDQFQASLDDIGEEQTAINEYKLLRCATWRLSWTRC